MTLAFYDEKHSRITKTHPITTEHNGTQGETQIVKLYLANEAQNFRHRDVVLTVTNQAPVDIKLAKTLQGATYTSSITWEEIGPGERVWFQAKVTVPPGQEAAIIEGSRFLVESLKYPVS